MQLESTICKTKGLQFQQDSTIYELEDSTLGDMIILKGKGDLPINVVGTMLLQDVLTS